MKKLADQFFERSVCNQWNKMTQSSSYIEFNLEIEHLFKYIFKLNNSNFFTNSKKNKLMDVRALARYI
ncbi:hypothetical protein BpHYR1_043623 [Brachionus plicatilis]|uniref:Uncharacterized protein n=1 Tax=Brachionus plicatilis TaxID=10195 RepID=A0A3M7QA14_BRAPC|nr:hypothetical protein BpHYR1_043623 [Brachionus plicatilis]